MVLVVDDDVGMVETLVDILSANGYDVAGAHSGGAFDIARVLDLISSSARPGGAQGARA